eukprot:1158893-Pelagomonas_calceolata.AAC.8
MSTNGAHACSLMRKFEHIGYRNHTEWFMPLELIDLRTSGYRCRTANAQLRCSWPPYRINMDPALSWSEQDAEQHEPGC